MRVTADAAYDTVAIYEITAGTGRQQEERHARPRVFPGHWYRLIHCIRAARSPSGTPTASLGIRLAGLTARVAGGYNRAGNVVDNPDGRMMGSVRTHLVRMLDWEESHVGFDRAVAKLPAERRGATASGFAHSPWQLLEHMRLAQADLLAFCFDPAYVHALQWPDDYWPASPEPPGDAAWDESVARVRADRERLKQLAADPTLDLAQPVPTGEAHQTYLRAVLLVADHTAYHLGQLVAVRRALGAWT